MEFKGLNRKYLRVQDLRRLKNLFFASRRVVEGHYAGRHASPQRGHSVEFNDYRQYMPGDEIGDIDWKIYGRTDKLFIKLFEHQSDMAVNLLVDASASMKYSGDANSERPEGWDGPYSKFDHACLMAASVAFLTTRQQDRVSLSFAKDGLCDFHPPYGSFSHLVEMLSAMEQIAPEGSACLGRSLKDLANRIGRRGLLVVFSDLLDDQDEIFDGISVFTSRGCEVILFHILHSDELKLPKIEDSLFVDSENGRRIALNVNDVRPAYEKALQDYLMQLSAGCKGRGIDYSLTSTHDHYRRSLEQYMFQRAAMV